MVESYERARREEVEGLKCELHRLKKSCHDDLESMRLALDDAERQRLAQEMESRTLGEELESFSYDVGYIYYSYPDANGSTDFGELYGALSWQWLETKVSYLTNAQSDASSEEDMFYVELNANFTILNETDLAFHIGQSSGDTVNEWYNEDDYLDYSVSLSKNGFTLGLTKTDLNDDDVSAFVSYSADFSL